MVSGAFLSIVRCAGSPEEHCVHDIRGSGRTSTTRRGSRITTAPAVTDHESPQAFQCHKYTRRRAGGEHVDQLYSTTHNARAGIARTASLDPSTQSR